MSEFGTLNLEDVQGEAARLGNEGQWNFLDQFVPMPEVKPGQTGSIALRLLPPTKGGKLYQYTRIHQINGRKVHCPRPLVNGRWDKNTYCPICEYYNSLWRKADKLEEAGHKEEAEQLKREARSIKPIERYYYNAMVRKLLVDGETKENVGPRILSVGKTLHQMIVRAIVGDDTEPALGNVTDIKNGYDFVIRKELRVTGDESFPNYDRSSFAREATPAGTPEDIKEWVEGLHDLTKLRNLKDADVMEKELAIHRGLIPDENEGFDVEAFDQKFQSKDAAQSTEDAVAGVVGNVDDGAAEAPAEETPKAVVGADVEVEDESFLEELSNMDE